MRAIKRTVGALQFLNLNSKNTFTADNDAIQFCGAQLARGSAKADVRNFER